MSIIGDTLDFGPYGFMERYDPHYNPNLSDKLGRYSYSQQPGICRWNCVVFAETIQNLLQMSLSEEEFQNIIKQEFDTLYEVAYLNLMRHKLGLRHSDHLADQDLELIQSLREVMRASSADYTTTFSILKQVIRNDNGQALDVLDSMLDSLGNHMDLKYTIEAYSRVLPVQKMVDLVDMTRQVPSASLRQFGIPDAFQNIMVDIVDFQRKLKQSLENEEAKKIHDRQIWTKWLQTYQSRLESIPNRSTRYESAHYMNPVVILRNSMANEAIKLAENGDYSEVQRLFHVLRHPYDATVANAKDYAPPKRGESPVKVSCSS